MFSVEVKRNYKTIKSIYHPDKEFKMPYSTTSDVTIYASCDECDNKDVFCGESFRDAIDSGIEDDWYLDAKGYSCLCPQHKEGAPTFIAELDSKLTEEYSE